MGAFKHPLFRLCPCSTLLVKGAAHALGPVIVLAMKHDGLPQLHDACIHHRMAIAFRVPMLNGTLWHKVVAEMWVLAATVSPACLVLFLYRAWRPRLGLCSRGSSPEHLRYSPEQPHTCDSCRFEPICRLVPRPTLKATAPSKGQSSTLEASGHPKFRRDVQ